MTTAEASGDALRARVTPLGPGRALFLAPYRPFFLCGAIDAVLTIGLWFLWIESVRRGAPPSLAWSLPPASAHAILMVWGVLSFFVFGFLLTAYVRWTHAREPSIRAVLGWLACLIGGQILFVFGALGHPAWIVHGGVLLETALLTLLLFLGGALHRSSIPDRLQPRMVLVALAGGAVGIGLVTVGLGRASASLYQGGLAIGLNTYLLLLVVSVAHRMVPFFTARAQGKSSGSRRGAALPMLAGFLVLRAVAGWPGLRERVPWAPPLVDSALLATLLWDLSVWRPGRTLRNPMIAVLYLGELWLLAGLALSALGGWVSHEIASTHPAVRHALLTGAVTTLVVGISARVTLGHSGCPIRADAAILGIFGLVQLAALIRAGSPLLAPYFPDLAGLAHWAALPWCLAFALWLWRLGPLLFRREP